MQLDKNVQRYISRAQGIIRKAVVEYLKREEPTSLKFVRVGISPESETTYKVTVKIYHVKPLRIDSVNEVVKILRKMLPVDTWLISAPHAGAIRIEATVTLDMLRNFLQSTGLIR